MKILVRLPNWLGDMIMSIGFINALQEQYPTASISVIVKKGIHQLADYFPGIEKQFVFSKSTHKGLLGAIRFGREIHTQEKFDLFFCLPDSFSSAVMGIATGAPVRIGYNFEFRSWLFTSSFHKSRGAHRVEEYIDLLQQFAKKKFKPAPILLQLQNVSPKRSMVININSEAISRKIPIDKAVRIINAITRKIQIPIYLIGGPADAAYVKTVHQQISDEEQVVNLAGKTSLTELVNTLGAATVVLTTDSGPAHVANATGVPTIVLFGAGNENNTAPYNKENLTVIRLGQLPCEPCVRNTCDLFGLPKCLELLDEEKIVEAIQRITG